MTKIEELLEDKAEAEEEVEKAKDYLRDARREAEDASDDDEVEFYERELEKKERKLERIEEELENVEKSETAKHYGKKTGETLKEAGKKVGDGMGAAASAAADRMSDDGDSSDSGSSGGSGSGSGSSSRSGSGGSGDSGGAPPWFNRGPGWWLITFLVAVHVSDGFFLDYQLQPWMVGLRVIVYLLIATVLYLFHISNSRDQRTVWVVALLEILGPFVLVLLDQFRSFVPLLPGWNALLWLYVLTPIFALYLSAQRKRGLLVCWAGLLLVISIFYGVNTVILGGQFPTIDSDLGVLEAFWSVCTRLWNSFLAVFTGIQEGVEQQLQVATGGYYKGMVEDQEGEPVGLYIEDLRVPRDVYYAGDEVQLWADLRGKSFEEEITVGTNCGATGKETGTYTRGETTPREFSFFAEGFESVRCNLGTLAPGTYKVQFTAGFNFRTWSYVTYTFVDQTTRRNYLSAGQDINDQLDIPQGLRPKYTPGPVMLGMSSDIPQPVGIDSQSGLNSIFGVTLDNKWTDGEIATVDRFDVLVPEVFKLTDCDAEFEQLDSDPLCEEKPDRCASAMNAYRFDGLERPGSFTTFTCRLRLADGVSPEDIIGPAEKKAQQTFVVKAQYDYALTGDDTIKVKGDG